MAGGLPSGTEISKGIKEQDPNSVFEVENTSGKSRKTSPNCSMAGGSQPGPCKSNAISRRCGGSRAQTRRKAERWVVLKRSFSADEGRGGSCYLSVRRARDRRDLAGRSLARVGTRSMGGVLQGTQQDAQKWGIGNPDEVAYLEVYDTW